MKININKEKKKISSLQKRLSEVFNMSTSVTMKGKLLTIYPVKTAAAIIAAIIVLSLIIVVFSNNNAAKAVDINFEEGKTYRVYPVHNDMMIYNNQGAKCINEDGDIEWEINAALSEPMVDSDKKYVLLCDLSGNHYAASYKNGKIVNEYKLGNDIISAKITEDGCAAFATDTDGYKGRVTVFNKRGSEIYAWNSGSGYITDIDLTDNGRYIAVAQLVGETEEASLKLQFIDTSRGEVVGTVTREGEVAVNVRHVSENKIVVVTDSNILGYNRKGKELFCISLMGKTPSLYNIDTDEIIAVATVDNRGNSVIEMYDFTGKFRGSYTATGNIRSMTVCGKRVVAADQKGVVAISSRGNEKSVVPIEHDINAIGGFKSGNAAMVVGSMNADIVKIK